jgi:outer membrane protein OmpA-like peptidoglycan-associated protein
MKIRYLLLCLIVVTITACSKSTYKEPEQVATPTPPAVKPVLPASKFVTILENRQPRVDEYTDREMAWRKEVIKENRAILDSLRKKGAEVFYSQRGVVVILSDVLFAFDKAELKPVAREMVRNIAEVAIDTRRNLSVEGHTDAVGSVMYNQELSMRRAQSVANALRADGVPQSRIDVRGYGKGNPIAENDSPENRALNRRVEVVIENQEYGAYVKD